LRLFKLRGAVIGWAIDALRKSDSTFHPACPKRDYRRPGKSGAVKPSFGKTLET
jgi:hypothetical protein